MCVEGVLSVCVWGGWGGAEPVWVCMEGVLSVCVCWGVGLI